MNIHFLRHATFVVTIDDLNLLVDPMLSPAQAMEPIANAGNQLRIPLVELPLTEAELNATLQKIDAVLVTHTHRDHWDAVAQALVPKQLPVLCQPEDQTIIGQAGFSSVLPVQQEIEWRGLNIYRTGGHHGSGELGKKMGPVSGFVLKGAHAPSLYIAGDTIWCQEVEQALAQFSPDVVVLYTGAATYATGGGPITMNDDDVCRVCRALPSARIVAVHMETVNHCRLTRAALRERMAAEGLTNQVLIPEDGEVLTF
jgi:L-ascorbate metabolism protein UlaG (beta-lactamase superfamily)